MTSIRRIWGAGLSAAVALVFLSLYQRGKEPANSTRIEDHSSGSPAQPGGDNIPSSDDPDFLKFKAASDALPVAYRTLARSTALPDGSVDPSGRTLPKEFAAYFANENQGHDQFVAGLSADGIIAFKKLRESFKHMDVVLFTEFVAKNGANEKPSAFDFMNYSGLRELVHEYPSFIDVNKARMTRAWNLLSQSENPVFRFLAIQEVHHVIRDKETALALLDARTGEVDPVIVHALIDELVVVGGDVAKGVLKKISNNALTRQDQAVSKAADNAIAKLR